MKKVLFVSLLMLGLAAPAMAQGNAPSGVGADIACGSGECFVPNFTFLGQVVKYAGSGTAGTLYIQIADCCLSGDKYLAKVTSGGQAGSTTTSTVLDSTCSFAAAGSSSFAGIYSAGTAKAQMKIQKAGGGLPAGAYILMSVGSWVQTAGSDSCGF